MRARLIPASDGKEMLMNRRELIQTLGANGLALAASALAPDALAAPPQTGGDPATPPPPGARPVHDMSGYGIPDGPPQQIAMLLYPQMTTLDLIGPQQIFATLGNVKVHLVGKTRELVTSDSGVSIQPTATFADCPDNLAVLFVPGGSRGTLALMNDVHTLNFLAHKGKTAKYVTSVCTGSLVLGAAGLLRGYKATSHWGMRDLLALFGATPVKERFVEDRSRVTGAGVTAGIDFALHLAARLRNEKCAKSLQLAYEYNPQPPYQAGTPESAPRDVVQMEWAMFAPLRDDVRTAAARITKRWR